MVTPENIQYCLLITFVDPLRAQRHLRHILLDRHRISPHCSHARIPWWRTWLFDCRLCTICRKKAWFWLTSLASSQLPLLSVTHQRIVLIFVPHNTPYAEIHQTVWLERSLKLEQSI